MTLSIVVNHYKSPEVLKLCLKYIKENRPEGAEIIVTDSETTEKTQDMMTYDFPEIKFLQDPKNIGFAKSVNRGIKESRGDFILIINADVIISDKNSVPKILAYMQAHEHVGMLGPRLLNINGEHQPSCFRFYSPKTILARRTPLGRTPWGKTELERFLISNKEGSPNSPIAVDWIMGSAMLVRREALERVGAMSEDYFMYMEDVDWCRNFWQNDWKVLYYPNVFFYHYHFQASKKKGAILDLLTNKYARVHLISAVKYFRKFGLSVPRYGI